MASPVVAVIGPVVRLGERLRWFRGAAGNLPSRLTECLASVPSAVRGG
jgi:hypothetical protein